MDMTSVLQQVSSEASKMGIDALLVSPGADLRYLTGYDATPLERLTCLVLPSGRDPVLIVPELERLAAYASPAGKRGLDIRAYGEIDDPFGLVADILGPVGVVGVDERMWAKKLLDFQSTLPRTSFTSAGGVIGKFRMVKSHEEIDELRKAAHAIDEVHRRLPDFIRPGRTEMQIARDVGEAILATGHSRVDFVIIGSGPHGASPHHEVSDRVLRQGDSIVVDIGGTMPSGYRSDCTRMYSLGEPQQEFLNRYYVLHDAQSRAVEAVKPGVACGYIDRVARGALAAAGLSEAFIHRTGHGIGLETHEDPYILSGSDVILQPGMAFSVEPGVYFPGEYGMRIEDIVVVTDDGFESLNQVTHDLIEVS
jgi:Xaa-Pro aminopeptidase